MPQRLPSLTSLRWFAALAVFFHHSEVFFEGTRFHGLYEAIAPRGATGVSFFFILSGFVLAWSVRPGDTARAFYQRRLARIAPAYWVACAFAFASIVVIHGHTSLKDIVLTGTPFTLLQAWSPNSNVYFAGNGVSWSLSAEMFFYALFPVVIAPITRLSPRVRAQLLAALVLIAVLFPLALHPPTDEGFRFWATYINPLFRVTEFGIGICLGVFLRDGIRLRVPPAAAASIAILAFVAAGQAPIYVQGSVVTLLPYMLLIWAAAEADLSGTPWLDQPVLVRLGTWSYCFYLVHFLVIREMFALPWARLGTVAQMAALVGTLALAVLAAYLLYRFVEHPLERRLRGTRAKKPALVAA